MIFGIWLSDFIKNRTWFLVIQLRQTHMLGKAWCNPPFKTHIEKKRWCKPPPLKLTLRKTWWKQMGQVRNLMKTCTVEKNILMKTCDSRGKISSISTKLFEFPRWSIITERTNRSQSPPAGPAHPYFCAGGASNTNCDASSTNPHQITYQIIWSFCNHENRTWFLVSDYQILLKTEHGFWWYN